MADEREPDPVDPPADGAHGGGPRRPPPPADALTPDGDDEGTAPPEGDASEGHQPSDGPPRPDEGDEGDEDREGYDELRRAYGQRVYNYFNADVHASGATFGFGPATATHGLTPGRVKRDRIDATLRHYLPPEPQYDEAMDKLRSEHIVVLIGEDGCGRRAGALALLRELLGGHVEFRSLAPADSLPSLWEPGSLDTDRGYALFDYLGELRLDAAQEFQMRRLSEELKQRRSYLVITASPGTSRRLALREFCVPWRAPDPLGLFDHCVAESAASPLTPEQEDDLRDHVKELRSPGAVVAVAEALTRSADAALELLRDSERQVVQQWFGDQPGPDDLLSVAALAFAEGIPERTFEKLCVRLGGHVMDWERVHDDAAGAGRTFQQAPSTAQSRARWKERAALARVARHPAPGGDQGRGERRITFVSAPVRALVITELHALYGYGLWYPMRRWLGDLAVEGDLEVRTEVARGVALLARDALDDVEENLLNVWADGLSNERVTATLALEFMCRDERLAPQALGMALRWAWNAGQNRAITAAMVLSGELASIYRMEALDWLWFLTERGERVAVAARRSLILLLTTAERQPDLTLCILRYVRTRLARAGNARARADALAIAVRMLGTERLHSPEPLAAHLLRTMPDSARHLGALWTRALLSRHRRSALGALFRTIAALKDDPAATSRVRALGEAMRAGMNAVQWSALRRDLPNALRIPEYADHDLHRLVGELIGQIRPMSGRATLARRMSS
ncbi:hypothetical protein [Streptomyces radicis]|uniref:hypothetical protein n=1 Tax=Streptomyces radicis TaxID=1750517 RepID=UPI0016030A8D|nr:hypothetical protein [Streptomyces radicis]